MDEKEKRILESATNHFTRYGYRKTSIDEIVKDAKVGKGMVYNYFKNKEALFKKVAEIEHEIMFNQLKRQIDSEPDPEKRLILYVHKKIKYIRDFFSSRGSGPEILKELKDSYDKMVPDNCKETSIISDTLEAGIKNRVFKIADVTKTADLISTILCQFELRWNALKKKEAETEISALFEILFKGLKG